MEEATTPESLSFRQKLLLLYERFAYVQKTGKNTHFKYRFMQESELKRRFNEACRELGLVVTSTEVHPVGECTGKAAVVRFCMTIEDVNSQCTDSVRLEGIGGGMDSGDKAPMKAVVAGFKYALANGLSVQTGDDPEADESTDEPPADETVQLLLDAIASATGNTLELCKPRVAALKGTARFDEVRAAFKARKLALTA